MGEVLYYEITVSSIKQQNTTFVLREEVRWHTPLIMSVGILNVKLGYHWE